METLPKLMTVQEACSHLARIGAIPGRKIGRRWVFSQEVADEVPALSMRESRPRYRTTAEA